MSDRSSVPSRILGACATRLGQGDSLENINTTTLDDGAFCYVTAAHLHYELHRDSVAVPDGVTIIAPIAGPGRWIEGTGPSGAQGNQGFQGAQGSQGTQGAGSQGATGAQGNQGSQGSQGSQGAGAQGTTGAQGFQGFQGSQGSQGSQGGTGTQGAQGSQGNQGSTGVTGAQGNQGFQGATGTQGSQGAVGAQGTTGAQGNQGFQGSTGTQGNQGFQGATGAQGNQGTTGAQGSQGAQGTSGSAPYVATAYVDPAFAGTPTGSPSAPFTTIAAAFAALVAAGDTSGIIFVPPNSTIVENVVFPTTGSWEIASQTSQGGTIATINGTIAVGVTSGSTQLTRRSLTNLIVTGIISGNGAVSSRLKLTNVNALSNVTLTGTYRLALVNNSSGIVANGSIGGTATALYMYASNFFFIGVVSVGASSQYENCQFSAGFTTTGAGSVVLQFLDACTFTANTTFSASSGTVIVQCDGSSVANLIASGSTVTNGTTQTLNGQASNRQTAANNVGSTNIGGTYPLSLMQCTATLTLLAAGTLGTAVLNVIYTDLTGALQTKPVTTGLNITAAVDTEASGTFIFSQNGATAIAFSVTGIVTPGALSYSIGVAAVQVS